jgi:hypothetical protein
VAAALGTAHGTRAIVAYDGWFATAPLSVYLPGVPWTGPGEPPGTDAGKAVTITELDIVGGTTDQLSALPTGVRLIDARSVDGHQVDRFALPAGPPTTPTAILQGASSLLSPAPSGLTAPTSVMIQRRSA